MTKTGCRIRWFHMSQKMASNAENCSFQGTFLAHLSRRLMGEQIVYQSLRRPSVRPSVVRQHFQTSSPLKPLGQLNLNFTWRLLRMQEQKFVQMVLVTWPRWPPCPYMVKTLYKSSSPEPEGRWPWDLVCSIGGVGPTKFVPNPFKWDFFWKVDFLNTVEAKVIILTWYVKTNETMAITKFQRSRLTFALSAKVAHIVVQSIY